MTPKGIKNHQIGAAGARELYFYDFGRCWDKLVFCVFRIGQKPVENRRRAAQRRATADRRKVLSSRAPGTGSYVHIILELERATRARVHTLTFAFNYPRNRPISYVEIVGCLFIQAFGYINISTRPRTHIYIYIYMHINICIYYIYI